MVRLLIHAAFVVALVYGALWITHAPDFGRALVGAIVWMFAGFCWLGYMIHEGDDQLYDQVRVPARQDGATKPGPKCQHIHMHREGSLGDFCDDCGAPV